MEFFIPKHVPSSKNSKVWTGSRLINSKACREYIKETVFDYKSIKIDFINELNNKEKPYIIGLHLVRKTKNKFDFNNISQIVADLLVDYGILDDDNLDEVFFIPYKRNGKYYSVDNKNHGVYLTVFKTI